MSTNQQKETVEGTYNNRMKEDKVLEWAEIASLLESCEEYQFLRKQDNFFEELEIHLKKVGIYKISEIDALKKYNKRSLLFQQK